MFLAGFFLFLEGDGEGEARESEDGLRFRGDLVVTGVRRLWLGVDGERCGDDSSLMRGGGEKAYEEILRRPSKLAGDLEMGILSVSGSSSLVCLMGVFCILKEGAAISFPDYLGTEYPFSLA